MSEYILGSKTLSLRASDIVGKGGEADIYARDGAVYKIFKSASHPDFAGQDVAQKEATARIAEHQQKLPAFPRTLPSKVITPRELVRDKRGRIAGYQMEHITDAEVLFRYGERSFREQGIDDDVIRSIFIDLHKTVEAVHGANVVIGDFNDLNVLVKDRSAYLIDADSMQFGNFPARMFTAKFVDPCICDPKGTVPVMVRPHSANTDWYAYLIMLMQSLLYVGPYGGVYRPKNQQIQVPHDAKMLKRITVFDADVRYPKPARPYAILPDALLNYFEQCFKKDVRGIPPLSLVENLRFTTCSVCKTAHARGRCPVCVASPSIMVKEVHTGTVSGTKLFETAGRILFAAMQGGRMRFLYHENGAYKREDASTVEIAPLNPNIRFRIQGTTTLLARGQQCLVYQKDRAGPSNLSVDAYGLLPLIDANEDRIFFVSQGGLYRTSEFGTEYREKIGDVLPNQTLFWVGDTKAFGFYRAAELSNFFMFRPHARGVNDSVSLPPIRGQLIDSTAVFGGTMTWFFTTTKEGTVLKNRCYQIDDTGVLHGTAEATPGDGGWLSKIRGACAARDFLLVPTDDGVMRIAEHGGLLNVEKEYPDTQRFIDADSHLFIGNDGLIVVRGSEVWRLTIG